MRESERSAIGLLTAPPVRGRPPLTGRHRVAMRNYQRHARQKQMIKLRSFLQIYTAVCVLSAFAVTVAFFVGVIRPASAQLFNFGGPPQRPQRLGASSDSG